MLSAGLILAAHSTFASAITFTETGDAGDIVTGAPQEVTGTAGDTVTAIKGTLTASAGITEADAFKIYISSPSTFSATTTGFAPGANNFDSQLFLFTLGGFGIVANDDDAGGSSQSTIAAGNSFTSALSAGYYYLLISGSSKSPASSGGLIFPNFTDGVTDPSGTYGPTGAGGGSAISSFSGSSNEGGAYSISLTGVSIFAAAAVPEPGSIYLGLAGGLALMALRRRQNKNDSRNELANH